MTINELTPFAFSIFLHRYRQFNAVKYKFKPPANMKRQQDIFFEKNKFSLQELMIYSKSQVQMRLLINYFVFNNQLIYPVNNIEYKKLFDSLVEYKTRINLYLDSTNSLTLVDVYRDFINNKMEFYIFYFLLRYIKFSESFLNTEIVKNKMIQVCKLMQFFPFFDEEYIKVQLEDFQKKVDLSKN